MADKDGLLYALAARVDAIAEKLSAISDLIGYPRGPPENPETTNLWDAPLMRHMSNLKDSLRSRAEAETLLTTLLEQFGAKLDINTRISEANFDAIARVSRNLASIEGSADRIAANSNLIKREKPLLMRDLFWLDTNAVEILFIIMTAGESVILTGASERLLNSAVFSSMAVITPATQIWATAVGFLSIGSAAAFASRYRSARMAAAFCNAIYSGSVGFITLYFTPGVLGWLYHCVFFLFAIWIVLRGPARSR